MTALIVVWALNLRDKDPELAVLDLLAIHFCLGLSVLSTTTILLSTLEVG
jgi:hypothetical protein